MSCPKVKIYQELPLNFQVWKKERGRPMGSYMSIKVSAHKRLFSIVIAIMQRFLWMETAKGFDAEKNSSED